MQKYFFLFFRLQVKFLFFLSFLFPFILSPRLDAAEIGKFSKNQAIVILNGDQVEVGKTYFVLDPESQKKKAKIKIDKITGDKAKATILKGKVEQGYQLALQGPSEAGEAAIAPKGLTNSWGVLGSYIMNSMTAKRTSGSASATTQMTGSSFGFGAFYNYAFAENLSLNFAGAYEQMTAAGTIASSPGCTGGSTTCTANITYLSGYGHANYYPYIGKYTPVLGVGIGFLFPMAKESTALNTEKISMNQVINFALGLNIRMNRSSYLPLILEYNYFAASDTVAANMIMFKFGWAWND